MASSKQLTQAELKWANVWACRGHFIFKSWKSSVINCTFVIFKENTRSGADAHRICHEDHFRMYCHERFSVEKVSEMHSEGQGGVRMWTPPGKRYSDEIPGSGRAWDGFLKKGGKMDVSRMLWARKNVLGIEKKRKELFKGNCKLWKAVSRNDLTRVASLKQLCRKWTAWRMMLFGKGIFYQAKLGG